MHTDHGADRQDRDVDVLYTPANERVAKAVAFGGTYVIWGVLSVLILALLLGR